MDRELLTGWGRTAPSAADIARPVSTHELKELVAEAVSANNPEPTTTVSPLSRRGLIARGLGRSYGDAAQCGGGTVVDMTHLAGAYAEDLDSGVVTVAAGVSLDEMMRAYIPRGWFVPVTPGTRYITAGGAIAADVHGKNHHVDGSFVSHVSSLTLITPTGAVRASPEGVNGDLFWATAGGMGLTGIVDRATLSMIPIETSSIAVDTERVPNIDKLIETMSESDHRYRYSVAWIDCLASGSNLGRAVLTRGDHASVDEVRNSAHGSNATTRSTLLSFDPKSIATAPAMVPSGLLNRATVKAFNELWFRRAPKRPTRSIESISSFFHPLDGVLEWNRLYGSRGFIQYQMVVPFGAEVELRWIVERLSRSGCASFLAVLKRFGEADPGPLSFPMAGWTLALDIPVGSPDLGALLDEIDEVVVTARGRVYLAKDSRVKPELVPAMYPRLNEWRVIRDIADPDGILSSDLSRRLNLTGRLGN